MENRTIPTLGARGFSCAVSGVGHVSIVTRFAARVHIQTTREINLWYPGYYLPGKKKKDLY